MKNSQSSSDTIKTLARICLRRRSCCSIEYYEQKDIVRDFVFDGLPLGGGTNGNVYRPCKVGTIQDRRQKHLDHVAEIA